MASILRTLTVAKKQFFARKSQFFFNPSCSFLHVIHCVCLWFVHDVNICTFVIAVVTSSGSDGEDSDSFTGFSQHTVCGRRHHITVTACCLAVMCFLMMGHRVWWPQWIRCWCWTALCGSPPRCSAPPWAAGSCPLRLGLNWPCCPTQSWFPWCSAACCSELWTVTTSDEVWSRRWPPGLWIHVSAWGKRQNKSCAKLKFSQGINKHISHLIFSHCEVSEKRKKKKSINPSIYFLPL